MILRNLVKNLQNDIAHHLTRLFLKRSRYENHKFHITDLIILLLIFIGTKYEGTASLHNVVVFQYVNRSTCFSIGTGDEILRT